MGELSKTIGEDGERLVIRFLNAIGWAAPQQGLDIKCSRPAHFPDSPKKRHTHGVDILYGMNKQLESFTVEHVVCSVKFTRNPYPVSPSSDFDDHMTALARALECYKFSEEKGEMDTLLSDGRVVNGYAITGVLFWLSNDRESAHQDVIAKVSSNRNPNSPFPSIQVVDNRRASFIYDAIETARHHHKEHTITFNYGSSSENFEDTSIDKHGPELPSEILSSPLLSIRITSQAGSNVAVAIACDDNINVESVGRALNYALDTANSYPTRYEFFFRDYDESSDVNLARQARSAVRERLNGKDVILRSLNRDFRSLMG